MGLVLDAGALLAMERGDRRVAALLEAARRRREVPVTSSGCVAQAWRSGGPVGRGRQALLARVLRGLAERPLDERISRPIGALCARTGTADVIDAHVALLARSGDVVLTSDPGDIEALLAAAGCRATIHPC
jgi:hypothetical protein